MTTAQEYGQEFQRKLRALVAEHDQQMKGIDAPILVSLEIRRDKIDYYAYSGTSIGCRYGLLQIAASYEFEREE